MRFLRSWVLLVLPKLLEIHSASVAVPAVYISFDSRGAAMWEYGPAEQKVFQEQSPQILVTGDTPMNTSILIDLVRYTYPDPLQPNVGVPQIMKSVTGSLWKFNQLGPAGNHQSNRYQALVDNLPQTCSAGHETSTPGYCLLGWTLLY